MTELDVLASEVGLSGRTLRRAMDRGAIRARRPSPHAVQVTPGERAYVRAHWGVIGGLTQALRTQPNVRLAVLYGSLARGDATPGSDLDVLVRLREDDLVRRAELVDVLSAAGSRRVQLVSLDQAESAPLLLVDVLRDGRVLVDRDADWPRLRRRKDAIARAARREDERLERDAWTVEALQVRGR